MANTYIIPNITTGLDDNLVQIVAQVGTLVPGLLMFVFFLIFLGGAATQSARKGYADYPMWSMMASISTLMITLLLTVTSGLVAAWVLFTVIGLTILCSVWYFFSKGRGEI